MVFGNIVEGRCKGCESVTMLTGGGWSFPACFHVPYKGKGCAEIKECPKNKKLK